MSKAPIIRALGLALLALLTGSLPAQAGKVFSFRLEETKTTAIWFSGEIVDGDYERLKRAIDESPASDRRVLLLESPGGSVSEGLVMGRYIFQTRIPTYVPRGLGCHSACTFMFVAGRDEDSGAPRQVMVAGAKIGFHQARFRMTPGQTLTVTTEQLGELQTLTQNMVAEIERYFNEIKVPPEFLRLFLSAPHESVKLMTELEALRLGVYVIDPTTERLMRPEEFNNR